MPIANNLASIQGSYRRFSHLIQIGRIPSVREIMQVALDPADDEMFDKHLVRSGKVMDMGFGLGRHFSDLQERGQQIYGIEQVPEFAAEVKREFPQAKLLVGDMADETSILPVLGRNRFDTILCLGNSLGGIFTANGQRSFSRLCWRLARSGGKLLVDLAEDSDGFWSLSSRELFGVEDEDPLARVARGQIQVLRKDFEVFTREGRRLRTTQFAQYYPAKAEIIQLFQSAGFTYIDTSGPYYPNSGSKPCEILVFQKLRE